MLSVNYVKRGEEEEDSIVPASSLKRSSHKNRVNILLRSQLPGCPEILILVMI